MGLRLTRRARDGKTRTGGTLWLNWRSFLPRWRGGGKLIRQSRHGFLQPCRGRDCFGAFLALFGEDVFRRAGDELLVRQFRVEAGDLVMGLLQFLLKPGEFLSEVDDVAERETGCRLADDELRRALREI